ncbi:MAG: peptidylprolyl isomerase [Oscillospiraceae bacterium]|nr:peptidylprolyl isomerase [Oscillospiraceae bacterium]
MKKIGRIFITLSLMLPLFAACSEKEPAETGEGQQSPTAEIPESDPGEANFAIINVRGFGEITVKLYPEYAPKTVERFTENVRSGFYTGRNFHRVISDFMIQGGSFDGNGGGDPNVTGIKTETHPDANHYYGAFCLAANTLGEGSDSFYIVNSKDTGAYEKRIRDVEEELRQITAEEASYRAMYGDKAVDEAIEMLNDILDNVTPEAKARYAESGGTPQLDGGYTVFGYTIDGFDVIDAISAVEVVNNGRGEISKPTQDIIIEWVILKTNID